jgi:pimeloyl-ACP methyl ester carboxylesterase
MREHEAAFTGVPDYIQRAILAAYTQGAAFHPLRLEALEAYAAAWVGPIVQPIFYRQIAQMDQLYTEEVKGAYGRMRCPVRLLWGIEDQWMPVERGRELARRMPDCVLIELPKGGRTRGARRSRTSVEWLSCAFRIRLGQVGRASVGLLNEEWLAEIGGI